MPRKWIVEIISLLFVILFLYTGLVKLTDVEKFRTTIAQSSLLTASARFISIFIPVIEILISLLLIIPKTKLIALYGSFSLMLFFTIYIIAILNFSERIPCACGGVIQAMGWQMHLYFNLSFLAMALLALMFHSKEIHNNDHVKHAL